MTAAALIVLLLLLAIHFVSSCSIRDEYSNLISNGLDQNGQTQILKLNNMVTTVTCEPIYDFRPCTTKVWGNLFLFVVYEYLLSLADKYISSGSNLFFQMFGTGIFGGSFSVRLLNSHKLHWFLFGQERLEKNKVLFQRPCSQPVKMSLDRSAVSMSMGFLAGSTMMSLAIIWGSVIAFGSYDLRPTPSTNLENKKSFLSDGLSYQSS
ncbi:unnamed protein product [Dovyalis caffra]|uniref:Uncharacterized protein n=1 Tax=Dovyalis caffra TaxID=77055 RepID=A0AAV1S3F2_9ROSI|nr:unnamed protein product [Dovyalis caffra]